MIVDIPDTTTSKLSKKLTELRDVGGVVALSRVLTLIIIVARDKTEPAIAAANLASREHPCRIIVLAGGGSHEETRLDAQLRVGGDAGASDVIVLHPGGELAEESESLISGLLLPDAPIVAWWADAVPENPAHTPIGRLAHRRITDAESAPRPIETLQQLAIHHQPGDTDLAWTRLTNWRMQLASIFDSTDPGRIASVSVRSAAEHPSAALLTAWLSQCLKRPVELSRHPSAAKLASVAFHLLDGSTILLVREEGDIAELHYPDGPVQQLSLPLRTLEDCLTEELRRLDDDEIFGEVLCDALPTIDLSQCIDQSTTVL